MASEDEVRRFQLAHRGEVARKAADTFDRLSCGAEVDEIRAELHRIIGTAGTYGLRLETEAAVSFHQRLKAGQVSDPTPHLRELAVLFRAASTATE